MRSLALPQKSPLYSGLGTSKVSPNLLVPPSNHAVAVQNVKKATARIKNLIMIIVANVIPTKLLSLNVILERY